MKRKIFTYLSAISLVIILILVLKANLPQEDGLNWKAIVYYSPTCGCCLNYRDYLKRNRFAVQEMVVSNQVLRQQKINQKIPTSLWSCHTTLVEGYVVEGHIPVEAINKLLLERPKISGIALPGMPSGSPGMPGIKKEVFRIFAFDESGQTKLFLEI